MIENNNEEVIRVLDFPENVRAKWGMYIDSANSCLREILDNATDESFTWKGCDNIVIDTDFNGFNLVADNGRGIPISMSIDRPDQTQADVSISVLHSGSKFVAGGNATVGTHGVGSACANALAERYILMSRITQDNYDRSIQAVLDLWNSKGPRSRKNLYYFVEYSKGYKVTESAGTLEDIEKYVFQGTLKGFRPIPEGYSTIVLFKPDPDIWGSTKTELPLQNIRNFLLIQEKFYKRKVTVVANGEIMQGSGFTPYQFEIMRTIVPADPSSNPDVKVYITFDIDKQTLGPKNTDGSLNGLDCKSGIHMQYAESCFEQALKNEYKIKHRMLTPGLRMYSLFLADDVQYSGQTKERCKSITKVKITDFGDLVKDFQKIFRGNPDYWEQHVAILEQLAQSYKNLSLAEKAEKLQVGTSTGATFKLRNELGSKLVDATAGPSERWDCELFLCFTGDTEMLTCNNERISMVDLERRVSEGENIYTFSCKSNGTIIPAKVIAASRIKTTNKLVKITLDNGESFKCTPNHQIMMRSGDYKEAKDLLEGDSVMPCYITTTTLDNTIRRSVLNMSSEYHGKLRYSSCDDFSRANGGVLIPIFRLMSNYLDTIVDDSAKAEGVQVHRHHIDKNKLNDYPTNLMLCSNQKHFSFHASDASNRLHELAHRDVDLYNKIYVDNKQTESFRKNLSKGISKFYSSEKGDLTREHLKEEAIKEWSSKELRDWRSEETKRYGIEHPEWRESITKMAHDNLYIKGIKEVLKRVKDSQEEKTSYNYNKEVFLVKCNNFNNPHDFHLADFDYVKSNYPDQVSDFEKTLDTDDSINYVVAKEILLILEKKKLPVTQKNFDTEIRDYGHPVKGNKLAVMFRGQCFGYRASKDKFPELFEEFSARLNNNHKVISVEFIDVIDEPVYCLEVDTPEHNFPLASGVFVKNCEGLSAAGSLIKGRQSPKYAAIAPLRGRVLNVDGMEAEKVLENKEFYTIFRAIGLGIGDSFVGSDCATPEEAYEKIKQASRYGKIIISTDADADGDIILSGICYAFSKFARFLLETGMVYCVISPFWEQSGRYFYPDDPVGPDGVFPIGLDPSKPFKRYKGLGSLNPNEIYDAFYNPATRRLVRITTDNLDYAQALVEQIQVRKNLLIQSGIITNPHNLQ